MKRIKIRCGGKILIKIGVLLVVLAACALLLGCVRGLQAIGWSGVAVSDDVIYVGSKEGRLVSVDSAGNRYWSDSLRAQAPSGGCSLLGGGSSDGTTGGGCASASTGVALYGTPLIYKDLVYIAGYNGKIQAYNKQLGLRWIYPREGYLDPIVGGISEYDGRLFVGTTKGWVLCLDAETGDRIWESQVADKIWTTPAVDGETIYITAFDKKLHALDIENGAQKWVFETEGTLTSDPLLYKGTVYFGSFDKNLYAVDAASGTKKWQFTAEHWFWSAPVIYNDVLYAGSQDGKVYAINAATGAKTADFDTGRVTTSPAIAGHMIVVATEEGKVYSIDTGNNNIKKLTELGAHVSSKLGVKDNIVYIHTADLTVHQINIDTGGKLTPISLKHD